MDPIKSEKVIQLHENSTNQHLQKISISNATLTDYEDTSLKRLLPQIIAGLVTATVFIACGASMAYTSILISYLSQNDSEIKSTDAEKSLIASISMVAIPASSLLSGILMDSFGRINVIKLSCIPTSLGWLIIYWADNVYALVISSFLIALSFSLGINPCLVYITEISNPNIRMSLLSIIEPYSSLGMIVMYFGGSILNWRNQIWIGLFLAIMPSIMCFWIYESPSWLILKGKTNEAKKSLIWIHQHQDYIKDRDESFAELSLKLLQHQCKTRTNKAEKENGSKCCLAKLLEPMAYRPIIILSALYIFHIFSGMTITGPYAITFMEGCGTDINPYFLSILIEFSKFVISIASIFTMKIFKRRTLLTTTGLGMAVSMCFGGFYTKWIKEGSTNQTWMPAVSLLLYNIFSTLGFTTLPTKFTTEFLPIEIRGIGYSILDAIFCGLMFTAIETYYYLNDILGGEAQLQWFFSAMCLGGVLFCFIFIPETKGMKLTEINDYFQNSWTYKGQIEKIDGIKNYAEI